MRGGKGRSASPPSEGLHTASRMAPRVRLLAQTTAAPPSHCTRRHTSATRCLPMLRGGCRRGVIPSSTRRGDRRDATRCSALAIGSPHKPLFHQFGEGVDVEGRRSCASGTLHHIHPFLDDSSALTAVFTSHRTTTTSQCRPPLFGKAKRKASSRLRPLLIFFVFAAERPSFYLSFSSPLR